MHKGGGKTGGALAEAQWLPLPNVKILAPGTALNLRPGAHTDLVRLTVLSPWRPEFLGAHLSVGEILLPTVP